MPGLCFALWVLANVPCSSLSFDALFSCNNVFVPMFTTYSIDDEDVSGAGRACGCFFAGLFFPGFRSEPCSIDDDVSPSIISNGCLPLFM